MRKEDSLYLQSCITENWKNIFKIKCSHQTEKQRMNYKLKLNLSIVPFRCVDAWSSTKLCSCVTMTTIKIHNILTFLWDQWSTFTPKTRFDNVRLCLPQVSYNGFLRFTAHGVWHLWMNTTFRIHVCFYKYQ